MITGEYIANIAAAHAQATAIRNYNADQSSSQFWREIYPKLTINQQSDARALIQLECDRINAFQARTVKVKKKNQSSFPKT